MIGLPALRNATGGGSGSYLPPSFLNLNLKPPGYSAPASPFLNLNLT